MDDGNNVFAASVVNIFTDILTTITPMPLIWSLKLPVRQRIIVISIFGLGLIVNAAGCVRTAFVYKSMIVSYDQTWVGWPISLAGAVEINLGLVCWSSWEKYKDIKALTYAPRSAPLPRHSGPCSHSSCHVFSSRRELSPHPAAAKVNAFRSSGLPRFRRRTPTWPPQRHANPPWLKTMLWIELRSYVLWKWKAGLSRGQHGTMRLTLLPRLSGWQSAAMTFRANRVCLHTLASLKFTPPGP